MQKTRCLIGAAAILAASAIVRADISPQAAPVVRLLEARYHDAKTLQAVFLERYSDSRQGLQVESGAVYFSRPGRMRWNYESPESKVFLSDGKNVWFYVPADHTVTRAPVKESTDWRTPLALLTGKAKLNQLCEKIDLGKEPASKSGYVTLHCRPKGQKEKPDEASAKRGESDEPSIAAPADQFDDVALEVNAETGELADVRVRQPGGVELEYRFGNWKENEPLEESLFHFQVPPGVAIVNEQGDPQ